MYTVGFDVEFQLRPMGLKRRFRMQNSELSREASVSNLSAKSNEVNIRGDVRLNFEFTFLKFTKKCVWLYSCTGLCYTVY